ncbi:hypothetical protein OFM36_38990, partial [Escherichia coli]|nr:hypothetical protein [Escherichia coli]
MTGSPLKSKQCEALRR